MNKVRLGDKKPFNYLNPYANLANLPKKQINNNLQNNMKKMSRMIFKSKKSCVKIFLKEKTNLKLIKFPISRLKA